VRHVPNPLETSMKKARDRLDFLGSPYPDAGLGWSSMVVGVEAKWRPLRKFSEDGEDMFFERQVFGPNPKPVRWEDGLLQHFCNLRTDYQIAKFASRFGPLHRSEDLLESSSVESYDEWREVIKAARMLVSLLVLLATKKAITVPELRLPFFADETPETRWQLVPRAGAATEWMCMLQPSDMLEIKSPDWKPTSYYRDGSEHEDGLCTEREAAMRITSFAISNWLDHSGVHLWLCTDPALVGYGVQARGQSLSAALALQLTTVVNNVWTAGHYVCDRCREAFDLKEPGPSGRPRRAPKTGELRFCTDCMGRSDYQAFRKRLRRKRNNLAK